MIGRTISHYEILEQIGDGGMGTVYKALDTRLQVHRALKFIHPHLITDPDFKFRFIQEAQAASSLDHPNICSIHQVDETPNGRPFICMTLYEGVTLAEHLKDAPLPATDVFRIGYSVARGLLCAHQNGVIHRDIKPGNIMITEDGFIKILDFGLAKLSGMPGVTKTGVTMGTVRYMSPEQATGEVADHRTDIWALGLLMYEMATGEFPFQGDFDPAVMYSILNTEPTPVHELNPDFPETQSKIIARCLEKDPAKRYQTIAELINDMSGTVKAEGWESTFGDLMVPLSNTGFGSVPARRRAWRRGMFVTALVAVAVAGLVWWTSRPPPLYTTDLRVAVMPLENKAHPDQEALTAGMWDVLTQILDDASRRHDSMWVVPNRLVRYSEIGEDAQAQRLFGVNRIVTGGLQRFEGGQVLLLVLRDAASLEQLRTVRIPFEPGTTALADSLPGAITVLMDLDRGLIPDIGRYLPDEGPAASRYLQGIGEFQGGDVEKAVEAFGFTTRGAPDFGMGWCGLGQAQWKVYSGTGKDSLLVRAMGNLERAVAVADGGWRPLFELGEIQRKSGNADEALEALYPADELSPNNPRIVGILARVLRREGRQVEAEEILKTAIAVNPDYFENQRSLATFYYWTDEEEASLLQYERTLALTPDDAFSLNTKGVIFGGRGEYTQAREMFERAYSLLPNCLTCSNIGLMLFHEGKFRESASYYELSLEWCGEDDVMTWANWAKALYWVEGGRPESISKFERAIAMTREKWKQSPEDPYLIGNLIEYHAMIGDRETTLNLIAAADSLTANSGKLFFKIGDAYELLGDRSAALRYFAKAIRRGIPVEEILTTMELQDLIADPRFVRMIAAESGQEEAQADSVQ